MPRRHWSETEASLSTSMERDGTVTSCKDTPQKQEEEQAKQRRMSEREEKRLAKEKEKELKAANRQAKAEDGKRNAEIKQRNWKTSINNKGNGTKKRVECAHRSTDKTGIQTSEISNSECAACFGLYEDLFPMESL